GFATYRDDVKLEGVIFNRIGSPRHGDLLRKAVKPLGIPVLGCVTRNDNLSVPHRHLGLVQALEHPDLEGFMDRAAVHISDCVDLGALRALAKDRAGATAPAAAVLPSLLPPLGQRIWVADDAAFAFTYRAVIDAWREAGAEVSTFSPLANEAPDPRADAVYLPGGYPELHADKLAANAHFLDGIRNAAARGAFVYGECGGYMVLGEALVDRQGKAHSMTGCLPVVTSFETPRLNLGYRAAFLEAQLPLGRLGAAFKGHEFHFAKEVSNRSDTPLFRCRDAAGQDLGVYGARIGSVAGSFIHLVDGA
ncbi:MAG: cobyrinate a,c-diamide synthase, partial [Chromatiales bacterium]|nr:cobyrinate a,c-diamide synthase [Chromatiales bacterium]